MACKSDKKTIFRFLDGSLDDKDERMIKEHLERCPECREFHDQAKSILSRISTPEPVMPPPYMYNRIRRDIETPDPEPFLAKWLRPVLVPALALLTFVVFGLGSVMVFRGRTAQVKVAGYGTDLNLQVFEDAPQSSLAQAYAQITGERK